MPVPGKELKGQVVDALDGHAYTRWPQLEEVTVTWRGSYGYVRAWLTGTESIPLCRLQYLGTPDQWGFALYQASTQSYTDAVLPTARSTGTPEQALDCACGLYLNDPTAWQINPPKD